MIKSIHQGPLAYNQDCNSLELSHRIRMFLSGRCSIEAGRAGGTLGLANYFLVQTASPNPIRYQSWAKIRSALIIGLSLWTSDKLAQGVRLVNFMFSSRPEGAIGCRIR